MGRGSRPSPRACRPRALRPAGIGLAHTWSVREEAGRGGMGVVYAARGRPGARTHGRPGRCCRPPNSRDPVAPRAPLVARSARAAAAAVAPRAIATARPSKRSTVDLFIVERAGCAGPTLPRRTGGRSDRDRDQLRDTLIQIAEALDAAHRQVHRAPRSQTGEHHSARGRPDQGVGFRAGEAGHRQQSHEHAAHAAGDHRWARPVTWRRKSSATRKRTHVLTSSCSASSPGSSRPASTHSATIPIHRWPEYTTSQPATQSSSRARSQPLGSIRS